MRPLLPIFLLVYEVDLYTTIGTIIPNECQTLEDVFKLLRSSVDYVQLVNIVKK